MTLRVLTLNLWNVNAPLAARFAALSVGLKALRPDIVCLQEVDRDPRSTRRQSALAGEACGLTHAADHEGLSILSRYPIARSAAFPLPQAPRDHPRFVLLAELRAGERPLLVANTHFSWRPEQSAERDAQAQALLAAIAGFAAPTVEKLLCGDFNDDAHSPALRRIRDGADGFRDTYAACRPGDPGYTYARANPYADASVSGDQRIDYIFATGGLAPRDCRVVLDGADGLGLASDHYGVLCEFTLQDAIGARGTSGAPKSSP